MNRHTFEGLKRLVPEALRPQLEAIVLTPADQVAHRRYLHWLAASLWPLRTKLGEARALLSRLQREELPGSVAPPDAVPVSEARLLLAWWRVIGPIVDQSGPGPFERTWRDLSTLELKTYIEAGIVREFILLSPPSHGRETPLKRALALLGGRSATDANSAFARLLYRAEKRKSLTRSARRSDAGAPLTLALISRGIGRLLDSLNS